MRCLTKSMKNGALNVTRGCGEMGEGGKSNGIDTGNETNLLSRLLCVLERCGVKLIYNSALLLLIFFSCYHVSSNSVNTCDAFSQQFRKDDTTAKHEPTLASIMFWIFSTIQCLCNNATASSYDTPFHSLPCKTIAVTTTSNAPI